MKKVIILTASDGKNLELANNLKQIATDQSISGEVINLVELDLPMYTSKAILGDKEEHLRKLSSEVESADGLVVVSPEYNGGVPPILSNAIAWLSVSDKDWRKAFNGKKTILATHSGSGGLHVLMALRQQFAYIGANVIGRQIVTNYQKELNVDSALSCFAQI
jgi:NAD(P)H-dependent FMN reductase